jgi:hypothetical protein
MYYKGHPPVAIQKALGLEEKIRHLIISYIGIDFQAPDAFYTPTGFVSFCYTGSLTYQFRTAKSVAHRGS